MNLKESIMLVLGGSMLALIVGIVVVVVTVGLALWR